MDQEEYEMSFRVKVTGNASSDEAALALLRSRIATFKDDSAFDLYEVVDDTQQITKVE